MLFSASSLQDLHYSRSSIVVSKKPIIVSSNSIIVSRISFIVPDVWVYPTHKQGLIGTKLYLV